MGLRKGKGQWVGGGWWWNWWPAKVVAIISGGERGEPAADARSELSLEKCFTREEDEHTGNELKCCNDCDLY